jgi:hypothetical protein
MAWFAEDGEVEDLEHLSSTKPLSQGKGRTGRGGINPFGTYRSPCSHLSRFGIISRSYRRGLHRLLQPLLKPRSLDLQAEARGPGSSSYQRLRDGAEDRVLEVCAAGEVGECGAELVEAPR